jgi:CRP-like cAMP-binding protein
MFSALQISSDHNLGRLNEPSPDVYRIGANLFESGELMGPVISFGNNQEVFGEGETAEYVYKIIEGAVRKYALLRDGRRQIAGFYFPGEIFGLEPADRHNNYADAITASRILVVKRAQLLRCAEQEKHVGHHMWLAIARELRRSEVHALLLIKSARERVAAFLLDMADRFQGGTIELPMPRQDIADYLGLTIETVCRILHELSDASIIERVGMRRIIVRNRSLLRELDP